MPVRKPWIGALCALLLTALTAPAPVRAESGRVLRGLTVRRVPDGSELWIRFDAPVRARSLLPREPARRVRLELVRLPGDGAPLHGGVLRESLRPAAGLDTVLEEVVWEAGRPERPVLALRFARPVRVAVRRGGDDRELVVALAETRSPALTRDARVHPGMPPAAPAAFAEGPAAPSGLAAALPSPALPERNAAPASSSAPERSAAPVGAPPAREAAPAAARPAPTAAPQEARFAVQLRAAPRGTRAPPIDPAATAPGARLYRVPVRVDGQAWERLRLGFFATAADAETARRRLAGDFPDAFVVEADVGERLAAAGDAPAATPGDVVAARPDARRAEPDAGPGVVRPPPARSTPAPAIALPTHESSGPELLAAARDALTTGDSERAVALLTRTTALPEGPFSPEARELLGVARERRGQRAHAKAEYEAYLARYPEGEGAARVRQRLESLLTAAADATPSLRDARHDRDDTGRWDAFGSVSSSYQRAAWRTRGAGTSVADSSLYQDAFLSARRRGERVDLEGELATSLRTDLAGDDGAWRTDALRLAFEDRLGPFSGSLGRLRGSRAGVIDRVDGARLALDLGGGFALGAVAGFPADPYVENGLDLDRQLVGLSLESQDLVEGLETRVFAVQQHAWGYRERAALGGEFRWAEAGRFLSGLFDYDVLFGSLNAAYLFGGWQSAGGSFWNLRLETRNLPVLTLSNALLGQPEDSLDDLARRFSHAELEALAEDRTARSSTAALGVTRPLGSVFQVSGDLSVSDISGTPASGGIDAFDGTGLQIASWVELSASGLLGLEEITSLGLGYVDSDALDILSLRLDARFALLRRFRLQPSLRLEQRTPADGDVLWRLRPGMRVDWQLGALTLDAELAWDQVWGERFPGLGDESGYLLLMSVRYDFRLP